MQLNYVYLRPSHLIGFRADGPYQQTTQVAWQKMFDWLRMHGLRGTVKRGFGMAFDDPRLVPAERCRYQACIDLPEGLPASAWANMTPQSLPGGAYLRYRHVGSHSGISSVISTIRDSWCSGSGVVLAPRRPLVEIYLDDPLFCQPEKLRTDLCLPVAFEHELQVA